MTPDVAVDLSSVSSEPSANGRQFYPAEKALRELGVVQPGETLLRTTTIFDSGMRSESWIYGIEIGVQDITGQVWQRYLREKSIISFGLDLRKKAEDHYAKANHLASLGIPQPRMYGLRGATLYQEFITADQTQQALLRLRSAHTLDGEIKNLLDQLINIGCRLDLGGYHHPGFISDLHYDGMQFLVIDTGEDLGHPDLSSNNYSVDGIKKRYPQFSSYINSQEKEFYSTQRLTA